MVRIICFFSLLAVSNLSVGDNEVVWPDLSSIEHVSGRPATEDDINKGAAVFLLNSEGKSIGKPLSIQIPQYAIYTDSESGKSTNVIVIQAEQSDGLKVIGALDIQTNGFIAGLISDFQLFGTSKPAP